MAERITRVFYLLTLGGSLVGGLAVGRSYLNGDTYKGEEELYGKTVIITGANRGIGKETAKNLAKRGARVILACRDLNKCDDVKNEIIKDTFNKNVECRKCDLSSLRSIKEFTDKINESEKFVNILVNNAGTMWNPKSFTKEGFETHFGVNYLGHFYLTNLLLPILKKSSKSRIVILSCKGYQKADINFDDLNLTKNYDEDTAYNQSKLANVIFGMELSKRLKDTNITVNCVDPGNAQTDILRNASIHSSPYSPLSFIYKLFLKTPLMAAQPVIYACVSLELEKTTGKYIRDFKIIDPSEKALDNEVSKRLWLISEKWIEARTK